MHELHITDEARKRLRTALDAACKVAEATERDTEVFVVLDDRGEWSLHAEDPKTSAGVGTCSINAQTIFADRNGEPGEDEVGFMLDAAIMEAWSTRPQPPGKAKPETKT